MVNTAKVTVALSTRLFLRPRRRSRSRRLGGLAYRGLSKRTRLLNALY